MNTELVKTFAQNDDYKYIEDLKEYGKTPKLVPLDSVTFGYKHSGSMPVKLDMTKFISAFQKNNKEFYVKVISSKDSVSCMILLLHSLNKDIVDIKNTLIYLADLNNYYLNFLDNHIKVLKIVNIFQDSITKLPLILVQIKDSQELMVLNPLVIFFLTSAWEYLDLF